MRLIILLSILFMSVQALTQTKVEDQALIWRVQPGLDAHISEDCVECRKNQFDQTPPILDLSNLGNVQLIADEITKKEVWQRSFKTDYERRLDEQKENKEKGCYFQALKRVCPGSKLQLKPFKGGSIFKVKATKKF